MGANQLYCERLHTACVDLWEDLKTHPFIVELAAGTLPEEKFRFYFEQNLLYLPQFSGALAIGVAKARDLRELSLFANDVMSMINIEIPLNLSMLARLKERGAADRGGSVCMAPANLAYTNFLLATAFRGGPLEILTAVLPCAWSYLDIARAIGPARADHPIYSDWIAFFADQPYADRIEKLRANIESVAEGVAADQMPPLVDIFRTGIRLERAFWNMAYDLVQWPDVATSLTTKKGGTPTSTRGPTLHN